MHSHPGISLHSSLPQLQSPPSPSPVGQQPLHDHLWLVWHELPDSASSQNALKQQAWHTSIVEFVSSTVQYLVLVSLLVSLQYPFSNVQVTDVTHVPASRPTGQSPYRQYSSALAVPSSSESKAEK